MLEKQDDPRSEEAPLGDTQNTIHLDDKTFEDLLLEFEVGMDTADDLSFDERKMQDYLGKLDGKTPLSGDFDVEASFARFAEKHSLLFESDPPCRTPPHKSRALSIKWLPRMVAVLGALLPLGLFVAQANGIDVFGAIGRWTDENFHFVQSETHQQASTSHVGTPGEYATLQEALENYSVSEPLVPTWIPEGYETEYVKVLSYDDRITFESLYQNGESSIGIFIIKHLDNTIGRKDLEKDNTDVDEYIKNDITHYLMHNERIVNAAWVNGWYECSMWGGITMEELEKMIDSIYEG